MPEATTTTEAQDGEKKTKQRGSPSFPADGKISLRVESNPKRKGSKSYDRFAHYKNGITVEAAVKAGVLYADLKWDSEHGFIAVNETPEQRKAWEADQKAKVEVKAKADKEKAEKKAAADAKKKAADAKKSEDKAA
jgi:membrane protein involved in colicin uptake